MQRLPPQAGLCIGGRMDAEQSSNAPHDTGTEPARLALAYALGFVGITIFGGSLIGTRLALADFSPWFITFGRAAIAVLCAAGVLIALGRRLRHPDNAQLFGAGLLLVFGFPVFMALALEQVPVNFAAIVLGFLPLATAAIAALLAGERHPAAFWALSFAGGLVIAAYIAAENAIAAPSGGSASIALGSVFLLLSTASAATGYVISAKLSRSMPGWEVICRALLVNSPFILAGTALTYEPEFAGASATSLAALAFLGLGPMFLGFFAWNKALAMGGIGRVGQVQLLQTFVTIGLAALFLGEAITAWTAGAAIAITAIIAWTRRL